MTATTMNVNAVIDQAKFKPFHLTVVLWCLFVVLFDGYDLAINGVALPLLMKEWGMTAVQAGMLASTALAGMMFGAMLLGCWLIKLAVKKSLLSVLRYSVGSLLRVALLQTRLNLVFYALSRVLELVVYYRTWSL